LADGTSGVVIGDGNGATASVAVHGAGALLSTGGNRLGIGGLGDGSLTVSQGASVSAATRFADSEAVYVAGSAAGTTGAVTVTDAGSSLTALGQMDVGLSGSGSLLIENQASVFTGGNTIAPTQGFDVGTDAGAAGAVTVSGNQSLLSNTGQFVVGDAGLGSLSIQSGGSVITTPGTVVGLAGAVIANTAAAAGSSVNVTGAGSDWQIAGALLIGNAGAGALNIAAGGTVSATTLDAASATGSAGIVSISGNNSSLVTTGSLSVGDGGSGELSILSGANVSIGGDLNIGQTAGGSGNVDIADATGTVFVGANLNLGAGGPAVLTVGPTSTLMVDNGGINGGPGGVLVLYTSIDPLYSLNTTYDISGSSKPVQTQNYPAYVAGSTFNFSGGIAYTLNTPVIYGASSFTLGTGAADSNAYELILNADSLSLASSITFSNALGTLVVGSDQLATIDLPASGTSGFTPEANPNLGLPLIGAFDGTIKDFQAGDRIIVDTKVAATFSQSGSIVSVIANTTTLGVLTFDTVANATAAINAGALVDQVPCFAAGTRIATERGEVAVEAIRVGERVRVLLGDGLAEVIWVGRRAVDCARHAQPRKVWPVRVAAGAFGEGRPHADVWLSPDHAVYVNEVLIPVKHLINGSTIAQVAVARVTYHHLELAAHDVLLAEGLPAESFLDMKDGSNYANRPGPVWLYPDYTVRMWEAFGCARLIVTGPELEGARAVVACAGAAAALAEAGDSNELRRSARLDHPVAAGEGRRSRNRYVRAA
ncbi:MAG TPA: Hint domain-containing protein, partial [Acidisphaera sp.]|nr:Hint domain-containing protein [Acidisphaera sp.]